MNIINLNVHKVNIVTNEITEIIYTAENKDFNKYLNDILLQVLTGKKSRKYNFVSDTSEMFTLINRSIYEDKFPQSCKRSSERLLAEEVRVQTRVAQMDIEIQKGILIHAHVEHDDKNKFIICKADDTPFIDDTNLKLSNGFPLKRKIFKSLLTILDTNKNVLQNEVYDTTQPFASYWWSSYLELEAELDDEQNTLKAFEALDNMIFSPIKKESRADHWQLRNALITTMKSDNSFDLLEYADKVLKKYKPINNNIDMNSFSEKAKNLSEKYKFDPVFDLAPSAITARIKQIVPLTEDIDLTIKKDIDTRDLIKPVLGNDKTKYIQIKSDIGYDTFMQKK